MNRNEFLKLAIATPLAMLFGKKILVVNRLSAFEISMRETWERVAANVMNRAFKERTV